MAWEDNFNALFTDKLEVEGGKKEWRFSLEEHKTKGTMQMNCRLWSIGGSYEGPTKNGFIVGIKTIEDIDKLEQAFQEYFKKVREML